MAKKQCHCRFTDKDQATAPIVGGNVLFKNKVPVVSRVVTMTGTAGTYDHDGDGASSTATGTVPIAVTVSCPDGVSCAVDRDDNGDIASITGYRISTADAGVNVPTVDEREDYSYLAFGAWVSQAANNGVITYGAFANGSPSGENANTASVGQRYQGRGDV